MKHEYAVRRPDGSMITHDLTGAQLNRLQGERLLELHPDYVLLVREVPEWRVTSVRGAGL